VCFSGIGEVCWRDSPGKSLEKKLAKEKENGRAKKIFVEVRRFLILWPFFYKTVGCRIECVKGKEV
jgi:hypothetical protein